MKCWNEILEEVLIEMLNEMFEVGWNSSWCNVGWYNEKILENILGRKLKRWMKCWIDTVGWNEDRNIGWIDGPIHLPLKIKAFLRI